jgi:hypothetical protein
MYLSLAIALTILAIAWTFFVRRKDLPEPAAVPPHLHLESRKAAIYENLRDLQFEYRVGKLSDSDYERTKKELQNELATLLAEIDKLKGTAPAPVIAKDTSVQEASSKKCPHCGAKFDKPLRFCGECGKPMVKA